MKKSENSDFFIDISYICVFIHEMKNRYETQNHGAIISLERCKK